MTNKSFLIQMPEKETILYIVHNYTNFQKDNIESASRHYKKIYVLVRYKPISWIVRYCPIKWIRKFSDGIVIDSSNIPENVEVIRTPVWYLPFGIFYKLLGNLHFRAVEHAIIKHKIQFDLVHSHFIWSSGFVGMKLKEKYRVPFVVTGHGYDVYKLPFKSQSWKEMITTVVQKDDVVVTVSQVNKKIIEGLGIDESKIKVLMNGYNSDIFKQVNKNKARDSLGIDHNKKVFLTVGNLEEVKAHEYLILAIRPLIKKDSGIHLYIIGAGSLRAHLTKIIKGFRLEKHISLMGYVSHADLNQWINACDIFVLSSLNEGLPTVLLEALGCGKPIVGTRVGGVPEIIKSSRYGLLVESKNIKELSFALEKSLKKKWDKREIQLYSSNFTVSNNVNELIEIYGTLFHHMNKEN